MREIFFEPRLGENWEENRVLILSESAYDWIGSEGEGRTPQPSHPSGSVDHSIENFGETRYFTLMSRALCRSELPTAEQVREAWDRCAYTIFIQETVGLGAGTRPSSEQWRAAGDPFLLLLEKLQPSKVVVTGKDMWSNMPKCSAHLSGDLQAYKLRDGRLVWCLAVPHPANRAKGEGFRWEAVGEYIDRFKAMSFPNS